jgi:S-DNA-T family DNA segregation ATPase FtsK/SpoIIIE
MVRFFGMSIFPSKKVVKGKQQPREISSLTIQIVGIFLATVGILCLLSILTFSPTDPVLLFSNASPDGVPNNAVGLMGSTAAFSLFTVVGGGAFVVPLLFVGFGLNALWSERWKVTTGGWVGSLLAILSVSALLHLQSSTIAKADASGHLSGGFVGQGASEILGTYFGATGATIILGAMLLVAFLLLVPVSLGQMARGTIVFGGRVRDSVVASLVAIKDHEWWAPDTEPKRNKSIRINRELAARGGIGNLGLDSIIELPKGSKAQSESNPILPDPEPCLALTDQSDNGYLVRKTVGEAYQMPLPEDLLDTHAARATHQTDSVLKSQSDILVQTLASFGIEGSVTDVHPGPVITMYEFAPGPGIKVARIVNLSDDLAMALKALKVRVVAPLPGKSTVGIEVPNPQRETVGLKDMLTSEAFVRARSKLALALGKDIYGRPVVIDLRTMPHLLVAGATGSGKSVGLNCLLLNILFTAHPDEVKLLLVDPKVLELQVYDGIPHLIRPVITNPKEAARGLSWVVQEMERRYRVLAELGVRNIDAYNRKVVELQESGSTGRGKKKLSKGQSMDIDEAPGLETPIEERTTLPYIVVVIDEFADLMMVAPKDIEDRIARLAQMARASGIHLILATQRPSVDVVTGIIKANFPARIAYQVSSKTDSRTILDANGAESLLGKGDMLFLASGTGRIVRLHGPYVSDDEVRNVVEWVKSQATPIYDEAALAAVQESPAEDQEADETYERARELVMTTGQASASFIQRRLRVGYPRAARMIEQMEAEGLVGAPGRDGRREVLARGTATAEIG